MKKYKTLYVNGCSHSEGGGLYLDKVIKHYKNNNNITYSNFRDVVYGKRLADNLGLNFINVAKSGSGATRLVRTTWDYINKHSLDKVKETIFYLQINNVISRLEIYSKTLDMYLVVNCEFNENGKINWVCATDDYIVSKIPKQILEKEELFIKEYLNNHFDLMNNHNLISNQLYGLFSFFKLNNIRFFIDATDTFFMNNSIFYNLNLDKNIIDIDGYKNITGFIFNEKMQISDDTNQEVADNHPGYFGHQEWANKLYIYIKNKIDNEEL